jgi:hypothetical protein
VVQLGFLLGSFCCIGMYALGHWMRTHTQFAGRVFFWRPRFAAAYFRYVGMFFMGMSLLGLVYYVLMAISRIG